MMLRHPLVQLSCYYPRSRPAITKELNTETFILTQFLFFLCINEVLRVTYDQFPIGIKFTPDFSVCASYFDQMEICPNPPFPLVFTPSIYTD